MHKLVYLIRVWLYKKLLKLAFAIAPSNNFIVEDVHKTYEQILKIVNDTKQGLNV